MKNRFKVIILINILCAFGCLYGGCHLKRLDVIFVTAILTILIAGLCMIFDDYDNPVHRWFERKSLFYKKEIK